ncbi:methyltransferase [Congregibacter sp.]|nr:methyltransferase [Congregibacter sp.]MDA8962124.1 methyltransferase [Congregibacter sp.]
MKRNIFAIAMALGIAASPAIAADYDAVKSKLEKAMAAPVRSEAEVSRDRNRKPVETLEFFGLRDDMKVVELFPGGGWYTKLLAPVLAEDGEFYVAFGADRALKSLAGKPGFGELQQTGEFADIDLDIDDVDMVLTFRNYHNFDEDKRMALNETVFDSLKPGGIYAVVDHTRRHMQGDNDENGRRVDPVLAIKEIQAAGFELVDYSKLHYRADDELRYEVGRKTVTGNTDRWTLKFRKP